MIERIARRAGGFASTTAMRWISAIGDSVPEVELPTPHKPSTAEKLRAPLSKGGAVAGTIVFLASTKLVRTGAAKGLRKFAEVVRPESSTATRRKSSSTSSRSSGSSNGSSPSRSSSNGSSNGTLSKKTRTELYAMAKSKNIPGRSSMSKEQLAKALGDS